MSLPSYTYCIWWNVLIPFLVGMYFTFHASDSDKKRKCLPPPPPPFNFFLEQVNTPHPQLPLVLDSTAILLVFISDCLPVWFLFTITRHLSLSPPPPPPSYWTICLRCICLREGTSANIYIREYVACVCVLYDYKYRFVYVCIHVLNKWRLLDWICYHVDIFFNIKGRKEHIQYTIRNNDKDGILST